MYVMFCILGWDKVGYVIGFSGVFCKRFSIENQIIESGCTLIWTEGGRGATREEQQLCESWRFSSDWLPDYLSIESMKDLDNLTFQTWRATRDRR